MKNYIKKIGISSICISILLIVISIFMIIKPIESINVVIVLLGFVLVIDGLIHFISYFDIKDEYRFFSFELAEAIIDIVLGFLVVQNSNVVENILPIIIGIWIVVQGITKIQIAFNIRGVHNTQWGIMFLMSLISIVLGVSIMLNPTVSFEVMIKLAGAVLLYSQIISLYDDVYFTTQVKEIENAIKKSK